MTTTTVPPTECLACGEPIDMASNVEGTTPPVAGDISFCLRCGNLARFTDDLTLSELTDMERVMIESDPRVILMQAAHKKTMKRHRQ